MDCKLCSLMKKNWVNCRDSIENWMIFELKMDLYVKWSVNIGWNECERYEKYIGTNRKCGGSKLCSAFKFVA